MKYAQHHSNFHHQKHRVPWKLLAILIGTIALALVLVAFVTHDKNESQGNLEDPLATSEVEEAGEDTLASDDQQSSESYQEISLTVVDGSQSSGIARCGTQAGIFTHVIVASLPAIDQASSYYEGWLVKPGIVDYFSTGELFAREDGMWGLVWEVETSEAAEDLDTYSNVVVTLEPRDGDTAPSAHHVLEGEF